MMKASCHPAPDPGDRPPADQLWRSSQLQPRAALAPARSPSPKDPLSDERRTPGELGDTRTKSRSQAAHGGMNSAWKESSAIRRCISTTARWQRAWKTCARSSCSSASRIWSAAADAADHLRSKQAESGAAAPGHRQSHQRMAKLEPPKPSPNLTAVGTFHPSDIREIWIASLTRGQDAQGGRRSPHGNRKSCPGLAR